MYPKQNGSALVMAIFIIIVVLLLATAVSRVLSSSATTIAYQVVGTRAFAAANSGAEYQLKQIFPLKTSATEPPNVCNDVIDKVLLSDGLKNCRFSVVCEPSFSFDGVNYLRFKSTGTCELDNGNYTSRTVEIQARSL